MLGVDALKDIVSTGTAVLQGSPEWFQLRCGKVTASRLADLTAKTKSGPAASRLAYSWQLTIERWTGTVDDDGFISQAMKDGIEREPQARASYAFHIAPVEEVAFVNHPTIPMCGCSPDGLVDAAGLIEIKCPAKHTHGETLEHETIDGKYIKQMQFQMAVTNRAWCDYVSFNPKFPERARMWVKRVMRDDGMIAELEAEVREFQREVETRLAKLRERYP